VEEVKQVSDCAMVLCGVIVSNLLCLFSFTVDITSRPLITISIKYGTKKESIEVENPVERTILEDYVRRLWPEFIFVAFSLSQKDVVMTRANYNLKEGDVLLVKSLSKGFSHFNEIEALKYAQVEYVRVDDGLFLDDVNNPEDLTSVVDKIYCELTCRLYVLEMFLASESTMREFIGPVLVHALWHISGKSKTVQMVAERKLAGSLGNGPVDYIMMYKDFNICVVEAKKEAIENGVNQNIAQMVASREDFCQKRKRSSDDYNDIPSCGIVTSGVDWVFLLYSFEENQWVVRRTAVYTILLDEHDDISKAHIEKVLRKVVHLIKYEMDKFDTVVEGQRATKKAKVEEGESVEEEEKDKWM
jgi:hypothetical protein